MFSKKIVRMIDHLVGAGSWLNVPPFTWSRQKTCLTPSSTKQRWVFAGLIVYMYWKVCYHGYRIFWDCQMKPMDIPQYTKLVELLATRLTALHWWCKRLPGHWSKLAVQGKVECNVIWLAVPQVNQYSLIHLTKRHFKILTVPVIQQSFRGFVVSLHFFTSSQNPIRRGRHVVRLYCWHAAVHSINKHYAKFVIINCGVALLSLLYVKRTHHKF